MFQLAYVITYCFWLGIPTRLQNLTKNCCGPRDLATAASSCRAKAALTGHARYSFSVSFQLLIREMRRQGYAPSCWPRCAPMAASLAGGGRHYCWHSHPVLPRDTHPPRCGTAGKQPKDLLPAARCRRRWRNVPLLAGHARPSRAPRRPRGGRRRSIGGPLRGRGRTTAAASATLTRT